MALTTPRLVASDPGPNDPYPEPILPPAAPEEPDRGPIGVPAPEPDSIDPGIGEPLGIPPGGPLEVPGMPPEPMVA